MKHRSCYLWLFCVVACVMLALTGSPAGAQTEGEPTVEPDVIEPAATEVPVGADSTADEGLRINFRGAPLDTVLDYLSKEAGFVIVRDAEVTGRVDVWSHQPLSKDEAVNLLNTILNEKGYAAIRNGRTLTIVNRNEAKTRDIPVRKGAEPDEIPKTDAMVTQIIPVRYADAMQLVENIELLLPEYATVTANQSSNAIVLTDTQTNIHRIAEIVKALDTSISEVSTLKVFTLEYADATQMANLINTLFEARSPTGGGTSGSDRERQIREFISRMRSRGGMPGGGMFPGMMRGGRPGGGR